MSSAYGPAPSEKYVYKNTLLKFVTDCTEYVGKLHPFLKFCIFRYTIGSASVNYRLIFGKLSENSIRWTYLTFLYYRNTFGDRASKELPPRWWKWDEFVKSPEKFNKISLDRQLKISDELIADYTQILQGLILEAPKTPGSFNVFKVASKYPALPDTNSKLPSNVVQLPFNSVTINPHLNYAPFVSPTADCCLFDIDLPRGSSCLFIPTDLHAYPYEHEIILPHDCIFTVNKIQKDIMNYIDPTSVNIVNLQPKNNIKMGNVYGLNEYFPCKEKCAVQKKSFTVYYCKYKNP